jgi:hypothetical protein
MDDLGFILTSWILTLGGMGVMTAWIIRRGRRLGDRIPHEDKPWT